MALTFLPIALPISQAKQPKTVKSIKSIKPNKPGRLRLYRNPKQLRLRVPSLTNHMLRTKFLAGNDTFAFNLLKEARKTNKGNIAFSPISLSAALAMLYTGASGKTASEIQRVLAHRLARMTVLDRMRKLMASLETRIIYPPKFIPGKKPRLLRPLPKPVQPPYKLTLANKIWVSPKMTFRAIYKSRLQAYFKTKPTTANFSKPPVAIDRINKWVAQKTNQRIKNLLSPGSITSATQFVLANAIYFKSAWAHRFYKRYTKQHPFWTSNKHKTNVPMMHQRNWFRVHTTKQAHVLFLPYNKHALSMMLVIPKKKTGLAKIVSTLNSSQWQAWARQAKRTYVKLYLPKFKVRSSFKLKSTLQKMGMKTAFSSKARFLGMTTQKNIKIDDAIHQCLVDVHEKGTEAAAATAIVAMLTSIAIKPPKPLLLKIDRPFLFSIRHNASGTTLFLGQIAKP
jgi:serpin B